MSKNKIVVREYLEGDEIDLSLQGLTTSSLPLKEMASLKKGKKLDLSKNQIVSLPDSFASSMGHLVKLDLSGNGLAALPLNFGTLSLLQHLDLFNNNLTNLPTALFKLKALKWLDLKENPLEYPPADIVGLCRNDAECKTCASQVVQFMKKENSEQEKQKQKDLENKRAKKEALKRELERLEELENQERKRIKQEEKSREKAKRRAEYEEKIRNQPQAKPDKATAVPAFKPTSPSSSSSSFSFVTGTLLAIFSLILLFLVMVVLLRVDMSRELSVLKDLTRDSVKLVAEHVNPLIVSFNKQLLHTAPGLQRSLSSAMDLLSEMLIICRDTIALGYSLTLQEFNSLKTYLQKTVA